MKTNGEKMSVLGLSTMLMITNDFHHSLHDVDENKGERRWTRTQEKVACSHDSLSTLMGTTVIRHGQDPEGPWADTGRELLPPGVIDGGQNRVRGLG